MSCQMKPDERQGKHDRQVDRSLVDPRARDSRSSSTAKKIPSGVAMKNIHGQPDEVVLHRGPEGRVDRDDVTVVLQADELGLEEGADPVPVREREEDRADGRKPDQPQDHNRGTTTIGKRRCGRQGSGDRSPCSDDEPRCASFRDAVVPPAPVGDGGTRPTPSAGEDALLPSSRSARAPLLSSRFSFQCSCYRSSAIALGIIQVPNSGRGHGSGRAPSSPASSGGGHAGPGE